MSIQSKREQIIKFRNTYIEFLNLSQVDYPSEEQQARIQLLRSEINRTTPLVISYLNNIGEATTIYYSPPPMIGGIRGNIDLIQNLLNPSIIQMEQMALDILDKGIGRYDYLIENQWKKWINPLHWIGEMIRLPFHLLRFSGFNASKLEFSFLGKSYKLIAGIITLVGGVIKIYQFLKPILQAKGFNLP